MATSGIFNQIMSAAQSQTASPFDTTTSGTAGTSSSSDSSASSNSATISANDFLTLLVTEMQNQDPTANTDPNEYINQLVQVNSLEQLIDINQTLSGDVSGSTSSDAATASSPSADAASSDSAFAPAVGPVAGASNSNPVSGNQAARTAPAPAPPGWSQTPPIMKTMHTGAQSLASSGISPSELRAHTSTLAGNLAIDKGNPAASRVGHALSGRAHPIAGAGGPASN